MSTPGNTIPLTEEHIRPHMGTLQTCVVRIFLPPHCWYAGVANDIELDDATCTLHLESSVRFERNCSEGPWIPGEVLVNTNVDRSIPGTKDTQLRFALTEAEKIVSFRIGEGVLGIAHAEGFTLISHRGQDVLAVKGMLNRS